MSRVLAATVKSLLLLLTLWGKQIQGWVHNGFSGLRLFTTAHHHPCDPRQSRTQRRRRYASTTTTTTVQEGNQHESHKVVIKESLYGDLGKCADVVMSAFYTNSRSPLKHLVRLAELSRLQQSFSYDKSQHVMYVAAVDHHKTIVGFCDIDLRPPHQPMPYSYNPRPYLSDLCVHPDYRRMGIGRDLVLQCEQFCIQAGKADVYIRVESNNKAAMDLYTRLGYVPVNNPDCSDGSILLLVKDLVGVPQTSCSGRTLAEDHNQSEGFCI